jgi:hypothetical protein
VVDPRTLAEVRSYKQEQKRAAKARAQEAGG